MTIDTSLDHARRLDRQDELAPFRDRFVIEDPGLIYLDGNSLGRLPKATRQRMIELIDREWGAGLIRSWNHDWMEISQRVGDKIARLVGADPGEVVVADSTSVNLFKLAVAAVQARPGRAKIVTDDLNFPSDHHILQGLAMTLERPIDIQVARSTDGVHGPVDEISRLVDEHTALVTLSHTAFKTSYTYDMPSLTKLAEKAGALMLWDLSHSVGSLPINLSAANVPLAVGCTYKHLNGGPGAPAFLYVRKDLQSEFDNPLSGWMGTRSVFDFDLRHHPDKGIRRFMTGTPFILSLAAIEPSLDLILDAGIERIHRKSVQLTEFLLSLWREWLKPLGFSLNSPEDAGFRGAHVSLGHAKGLQIDQALIHDMQVVPDFRPPDTIRFGMAPLYTTFEEVWEGMRRLKSVTAERGYEKFSESPLAT